jgi:hypothetical protein
MNTNNVAQGLWNSGNSPRTTTTKKTTTKKKFDKDGRVVSETTTVVEESVTTYNYPYTYTNAPNTVRLGDVKYGRDDRVSS